MNEPLMRTVEMDLLRCVENALRTAITFHSEACQAVVETLEARGSKATASQLQRQIHESLGALNFALGSVLRETNS